MVLNYRHKRFSSRARRGCDFAALALSAALLTGCYDRESLVRQARSAATSPRLAEVDFGIFQVTLPRDPRSGSSTDLNLHLFGTVPRSHRSSVKKQLLANEYLLRHRTLAALRSTNPDELTDPELTQLRHRLQQVVNELLPDSPVQTIGFYQITLARR